MNATTAEREWLSHINNKPVRSEERKQPAIEVAFHIDRNIPWKRKEKDSPTMRYQMKEICAIVRDEDDKYVSLLLPRFAEVEEGEETVNLAVCNKMTRDLKLAKVYIDQTFKYVTASCEFFYSDEDSLKEHIEMSMNVLGILRSLFRNTKSEWEKEEKT